MDFLGVSVQAVSLTEPSRLTVPPVEAIMTADNPETSSETSATIKQQDSNVIHSEPQEKIDNNTPKDPEKPSEESEPAFYERAGGPGGSRPSIEADSIHARPSDSRLDRYSKRSRWLGNVKAYQAPNERNSETTLKLLRLTWGKDSSKGLVFNLASPKASANLEAASIISWQYDIWSPGHV